MSHNFFLALALTAMLALPSILFAQDFKRTFGDVAIEDFKPSPDDSSEAVVLFEIGKADIDPWRGTVLKIHRRTRILKQSGANKYGGDDRFLVEKGAFSKPIGATYNLVGNRVEKSDLAEASIIKSKFNRDYDMITIAFPNVREGSIVEIQYAAKDDAMFMPDWNFQKSIPVIRSEYSFNVPIDTYVTYFSGELKPDKHDVKFDTKFQYWLMTNIPAFKSERMMPHESAYRTRVQFGTRYLTWPAIHAALVTDPYFFGHLDRNKYYALKDRARDLTIGITDSLKMIQAISDHVKKTIAYDDSKDCWAIELDKVLEKKTGSAGDINILLAVLLKRAGFNVSLVLLSTRENGHVQEAFTSLSQFDYVVALVTVNKKDIFLDATDINLPFDMLPKECLNHKGFLVAKNQFGWVPVVAAQREKITVDANVTLAADGSLNGQIKFARYGYAAYDARALYNKNGEASFFASSLHNKAWNVTQRKIEDISDLSKPVSETYDVNIPDHATLSGTTIYINPHIFLKEESNPFTSPSRRYPIDFGLLKDHMAVTTITLPDGYDLETIPENKVITLPQNSAKCTFNFTKAGNKITVMSRLQINKTLLQPEEYQPLKELYTRLVAKQAETLVVIRKP
jgi:hypothetical protein